jgi:hypothetical protein
MPLTDFQVEVVDHGWTPINADSLHSKTFACGEPALSRLASASVFIRVHPWLAKLRRHFGSVRGAWPVVRE